MLCEVSFNKKDLFWEESKRSKTSFQQIYFVSVLSLNFRLCRQCVWSNCDHSATCKEFFCLIGMKTIRNSVICFNEIMLPAFSSFMENACFVVRTKNIFNTHIVGNNTIKQLVLKVPRVILTTEINNIQQRTFYVLNIKGYLILLLFICIYSIHLDG